MACEATVSVDVTHCAAPAVTVTVPQPVIVVAPSLKFTVPVGVWPVMVAVYLFNGSFVVMNYQFVNGLLFTIAGILAAQNRRIERSSQTVPV